RVLFRKKGISRSPSCWRKCLEAKLRTFCAWETIMVQSQPNPPRLLQRIPIPVDRAAFNGVPSVTALKLLPSANVLLAAAMDRRVVACDVLADPAGAAPPKGPTDSPRPVKPAGTTVKHLAWSHDNWIHTLDVHPDGARVATGGADRRIKLWKWGQDQSL